MASFDPPPETQILHRNAHIFAGNGDYLGGLSVNDPPQVSNAALYRICTHFINLPPSAQPNKWSIHRITASNEFDPAPIPRASSSPFQQGRYAILSPSAQLIPLSISTEPALHRLQTPEPPAPRGPDDPYIPDVRPSDPEYPRNKLHFEERLIARDRVCAITGERELPGERLFQLKATHIFPLSMRESCVRNGYDASWIREDPDDYDAEGKSLAEPDKLFSPQNGLLLDVAAKLDWDVFRVTVDPENGYRSVTFCRDKRDYGGKPLNPTAMDETRLDRVSDECLRWHFHQSILTVVRGLSELMWDQDVMYENAYETGEYDEDDLIKERESMKQRLEWEFGVD
ncbi:hypothetical protein ASPCAL08383 [Aspergillus calidoustus]|uniref:HNH nuclease domain-containing protein n=1 Tax=Aspergillus calidoustus TaxID=454130 RepID=A0A0U5GQ08_ASPCI|nr:hypothetical protein ASPCAL08383 [Aspergillus calidoustus]